MNISKSRHDSKNTWTITKKGRKVGVLYSGEDNPMVDIRTRHEPMSLEDIEEIIQICKKEFITIKRYGLW